MPPAVQRLALAGRVVTMDEQDSVLNNGVVYVADGVIQAVQPRTQPAPPDFAGTTPVSVGGTMYPGLIELHNHMAFDILRLWQVPRPFTNRDKWRADSVPDYRRLISGPMTVLGKSDAVAAIVRYVEAKCLLGGTTTGQGVRLNSAPGIVSFFRGVVRNVESPGDGLPAAATHVQDVDARDAARFKQRLAEASCMLLHLAEGIDDAARRAFLALRDQDGDGDDDERWAIAPSLAGIHCTALSREDFEVLARLGGAMVWSPLSNHLLYGRTADMAAATGTAQKLRIGLGADWSPSGSKNLLGELKVAKLCSDEHARVTGDPLLSDAELVALATRNAAAILGWPGRLGVLAPGARADIIAITGAGGDPYRALLRSAEHDLRAVVIAGVARSGTPALMGRLGAPITETLSVGGRTRALNLDDPTTHPEVAALTVAQAKRQLRDALARLPELAREQEDAVRDPSAAAAAPRLELVLDELEDNGFDQRPRLPLDGELTGPDLLAAAPAPPLSTILGPLGLDPLTVVDDKPWLEEIGTQTNLPPFIREGLPRLYP